eukprot:UN3228
MCCCRLRGCRAGQCRHLRGIWRCCQRNGLRSGLLLALARSERAAGYQGCGGNAAKTKEQEGPPILGEFMQGRASEPGQGKNFLTSGEWNVLLVVFGFMAFVFAVVFFIKATQTPGFM